MSQDRGNYRGKRNYNQSHGKNKKINVGDKGKEVLENINENNPVIKQFQEYAAELDTKHDRYERLVKISRDITIESKRIIFLLHTLDKESKRNAVLGEAEARLNNLIKVLFKNIAQELDGEDQYLYLRAFRPGLQEFVEALTFYWYLQNSTLYNWTKLADSMTYTIDPTPSENVDNSVDQNEDKPAEQDNDKLVEQNGDKSAEENDVKSTDQKTIQTLIVPTEYVLGVADLTGELMRRCINNLASGDIASCYQTCNFVRNMYKGFLGCAGVSGREVGRKIYVLQQSLLKIENVCYMIKVRGSEIPKHMLVDVAMNATENISVDEDEGYQVY